MRLQMWLSYVLTQALENLRYLRTKGQVKQWQAVLSLSLKRTFGHFEQPLPMLLDLGIPPLALQQAKQPAICCEPCPQNHWKVAATGDCIKVGHLQVFLIKQPFVLGIRAAYKNYVTSGATFAEMCMGGDILVYCDEFSCTTSSIDMYNNDVGKRFMK